MRSFVNAAAIGALFVGGASLAIAQGPGGSPGGDPKPPAKDGAPSSGDKKVAPEKKESGSSDRGRDDSRAGRCREDSDKKAEARPGKAARDSAAGDREGDKSDRRATDAGRKEETPKASAPSDDKADRKATDTRRKDETDKASAPGDDKADRKATDTRRKDDAKASAPATDTPGKTSAPGSDGKKGVELSDQKRTTVHEKLSRDRTRHATNVRITVSIGATVPRTLPRLRRGACGNRRGLE